jgi:hypothetical protein
MEFFVELLTSWLPDWFGDGERQREVSEEDEAREREEAKRLRRKAWAEWSASHGGAKPPH